MRYLLILYIAVCTVFCCSPLPGQDILKELQNEKGSPGNTAQQPKAADKPTAEPKQTGDGDKDAQAPSVQQSNGADGQPAQSKTADDQSSAAATGEKSDGEPRDTSEESGGESGGFVRWLNGVSKAGPLGMIRKGGLFMWPILILGVLAAGVIIERYRSLRMLDGDTQELRTSVSELLHQDRVEDAYRLCNDGQGPVAAVLASGLRKYLLLARLKYDAARTQQQVVDAMEDNSVHIVAALERHLPILATISSVAPMLGFLGTVAGMITSFDDIRAMFEGSGGGQNIVLAAASGISVALITTCFGLIIGIPAFIAYNYFTGIINGFVLEVEESTTELIEGVTLQLALAGAGGPTGGDHNVSNKTGNKTDNNTGNGSSHDAGQAAGAPLRSGDDS